METILVTGGAGFIGSAFVRSAVASSWRRVVNLDKLTYAGNLDSLAPIRDEPDHVFVHGDIGDAKLVKALLAEHRPTALINLAAESHVDRSIDEPAPFILTNVLGLSVLLEVVRDYRRELAAAPRDAFRFLHVSTDEVYGSRETGGAFKELDRYKPSSPYAASKAAGDHLVAAYHRTYGLPTLITNCTNNYGPYQFPEKLIPLMIQNALSGEPLPIYGDGGHLRDWLHVDDHCDALRVVLERGVPGEQYNIAGHSERTNLEVVRKICESIDRLGPDRSTLCKSLIAHVEDRPGHDRRYAIDATKIESELEWRPTTDFDAGLERTVRWYLDNQPWVERVTSGKYRRERLGRASKD